MYIVYVSGVDAALSDCSEYLKNKLLTERKRHPLIKVYCK